MFKKKTKYKETQVSKELIGNALTSLRKSMNLTQQELADKVGKPQSTIARIETGETNPSFMLINEIAKALNKKVIIEFEELGIAEDWTFPLELFEIDTEIIKQQRKQAAKWAKPMIGKFESFLRLEFTNIKFEDFKINSSSVRFCYSVEFSNKEIVENFEKWGWILESMLGLKKVTIFHKLDKLFIDVQQDKVLPINISMLFEKGLSDKLSNPLEAVMGEGEDGEAVTLDVAEQSLMLVSGIAGAGKSVGIINLMMSIMAHSTPEQVNFALISSDITEFSGFQNSPFLFTDIITDSLKSYAFLEWVRSEVDRRRGILLDYEMTINEFNERVSTQEILSEKIMPLIIVIDEYNELTANGNGLVEAQIRHLAQENTKEVGVHIIVSVQRPTRDLSYLKKLNSITGGWSFRVSNSVMSDLVLGEQGAEQLRGRGDSIFCQSGMDKVTRLQTADIDNEVINSINNYIIHNKKRNSTMLQQREYLNVAARYGLISLVSQNPEKWVFKDREQLAKDWRK